MNRTFINFFEDPIPVKCDLSYDWKIELLKFTVQYLYLISGIVLNLLILKTLWWKYSKIYGNNSYFVLFSADCLVNILILLTEGLIARLFIYITPLCLILSEYFAMPLIGFKFIMILVHHSKICKSILQSLLVLNRMTCVILPVTHDFLWKKYTQKIIIPLVFLIPLSVDWNLLISRVLMTSSYGGFWISYSKYVRWASQSRFQLLFILPALGITLIGTLVTLAKLAKLPAREKNLEKAISRATWVISIGFSGTALFQIYYGFFYFSISADDPMFGLNFLSWDFLTVGSPIVMLFMSGTLRRHVFGIKNDVDSVINIRSRTL